MSDEKLRALERAWAGGDAGAGAQLVVEILRRGEHLRLARPDLSAWQTMWEEAPLNATAVRMNLTGGTNGKLGQAVCWRDDFGASLLLAGTGTTDGADHYSYAWVGKLETGEWFLVTGGHGPSGFDSDGGGTCDVFGFLDDMVLELSSDVVRMLLAGTPKEAPVKRSDLVLRFADRTLRCKRCAASMGVLPGSVEALDTLIAQAVERHTCAGN